MNLKDAYGTGSDKQMNFRQKFIKNNLSLCRENRDNLSEWEGKFLTDTLSYYRIHNDLTSRHYNKLKEIAEQFK